MVQKQQKTQMKTRRLTKSKAKSKSHLSNSSSGTIRTGVDRLLDYLEKKRVVSLSELQKHFEISAEVLDRWVEALVEDRIIEKNYTTQGIVLLPFKQQKNISPIKSKKQTKVKKRAGVVQKFFRRFLHGRR